MDMVATAVCAGGLLGLIGLVFVAVWESARKGNADGYRALRNRCYELTQMLHGVEGQRDALAWRVDELERYYRPYRNLLKQLDAQDQAQAALQHENKDLRKRLDVARVLVLALAAKAGVRVDGDPVGGEWRVV